MFTGVPPCPPQLNVAPARVASRGRPGLIRAHFFVKGKPVLGAPRARQILPPPPLVRRGGSWCMRSLRCVQLTTRAPGG